MKENNMENTNDKKYWRGLEELYQEPEFVENAHKEFERDIPVDELLEQAASTALTSNRREFLKYLGFSIGAATLAACTSTPVKYALPYVVKPNEITPGVANYYSSTFWDGLEYVAIRVKTREGRPIKIEGNPESPISLGGTSARSQASVLSLYDNNRLKGPQKDGKPIQWEEADNAIKTALANGGVYLITASTISPSTKNLFNRFAEKFKAKIITYDPISYSGMLEANLKCFGKKEIPSYHFDKCEVVVGFNADFLGTWLSPTGNIRKYTDAKRILDKKDMLLHIQFETNMTLTGANADKRIPMKPSQEGAALLALYNTIATKLGKPTLNGDGVKLAGNYIEIAASKLVEAKGKSIVVAGSNDPNVQILANGINAMLGNYGSTIDLDNSTNYFQGIDSEFESFVADLEAGKVKTVIFANSNPIYNYYASSKLEVLLKNVETKISFAQSKDETANLCNYLLPDSHYLESWSDAQPTKSIAGLQQPTINKLFDTRQYQDSLLVWLEDKRSFYQFVKDFWKENFWSKEKGSFEDFWIQSLQSGYAEIKKIESKSYEVKGDILQSASTAINEIKSTGTEVQLYVKIGIGDGSAANNPWLQELPDPITKVCWDNYVTIGKAFADKLGLKTDDVVNIVAGSTKIKLPVWVQPGQTNETIGIALGYGRKSAGKAGNNVGANAYSLVNLVNGNRLFYNTVSIEKTGETYELAATQTHHTIMGRSEDILREYSHTEFTKLQKEKSVEWVTLYKNYEKTGHYWAMAIDLNACVGCGSCVVACQAENNVAVVGKKEILMRREMHWIRIDRYYSATGEGMNEQPEENPTVTFQPMMCQHCDNAPCENVCPVLAIAHSSEGLNQQVYNRCVGTRYCANNCPYKVRRFNWFDYTNHENFIYNPVDDLGRMVLNPDVVVRARGVMEKCSFCVQRLQAAKLSAKAAGTPLPDGSATTACQTACPANAIIFGDLNDPNSKIAKYYYNERSYRVIEAVKTYPHISYMGKVRHKIDNQKV